MNDEIKEILNKLQYGFCSQLTYEKLLDYITNLQQENEQLDQFNQMLTEIGEDYKSRCEKAVEYIKINFVEDIITVKTLLNILNGRSDE